MWWVWLLGGLAVWTAAGLAFALVMGRAIRTADEREPGTGVDAADPARQAAPVAARRAVPLPTLGLGLVAIALALETAGYLARLTGATGATARALSMDAPWSLPRLFVALLFVAAALAAVAGAGIEEGRRTWWLAVGLVAGTIAAVKAGSTVHADALGALASRVGDGAALAISGALAAGVVAVLWMLSRRERRDRRRVLGALSLYAVAVVGLSALSGAVADAWGRSSTWAAAATYVEESAEALAAVAFLLAVLVGVAPRLVLPGSWALRRAADAHTLDLPEALPGTPSAGTSRG